MPKKTEIQINFICFTIAVILLATFNTITGQVVPTNQLTSLWLRASAYMNWGQTRGTSGYGIRDNAGNIEAKNSGGSWVAIAPTGGSAPLGATYITQTADVTLTNEQAIGALSSGILRGATTTGVITSLSDTLPAANGGTGLSTYAVGDIPYASATTPVISKLAAVASGSVLTSAGINTAPAYSSSPSLSGTLTVNGAITSTTAGFTTATGASIALGNRGLLSAGSAAKLFNFLDAGGSTGIELNIGVPTLGTCTGGTLVSGAHNFGGEVTGNTSGSCVINFGTPNFTNTPFCFINDETALIAVRISARSASSITVTGAGSGDAFQFFCVGRIGT